MPKQTSDLDRVFNALCDPARRAIVERLTLGPAPVTELALPLPMALSSVMQHLDVLQSAGLVTSQKAGRVRMCSIDPRALSMAEQWINGRRSQWERRLDRLGDFLSDSSKETDDAD